MAQQKPRAAKSKRYRRTRTGVVTNDNEGVVGREPGDIVGIGPHANENSGVRDGPVRDVGTPVDDSS